MGLALSPISRASLCDDHIVTIIGPLCGTGSDNIKTILDNIGAVSDSAKIRLGNISIVFSILFSDDIIGSAIISNLIVVQADLYINNRMRSISLLILNLYKISDVESFVKVDLI